MRTKQRPTLNPHKQCEVHKAINQQEQNHRLRKDTGDFNAFYWRQIFALDFVVKTQKCLVHMRSYHCVIP